MFHLNKNKFLNSDEETIVARCTPSGSGAIAVLRLCGANSISIADKISKLSSGKKFSNSPTHSIYHGYVVLRDARLCTANSGTSTCSSGRAEGGEEQIDEVLFMLMRGPKTFTGQDTIEINCHNNPFIIEKIIELVIKNGARLAQRGEFTKRAFLNNKIDLVQAESINEIIGAQTEQSLKKSMSQLKGTLSCFLKNIEQELIGLLSLIEASFEFLEEEQADIDLQNSITNKIDLFLQNLKQIKKDFSAQQQIRQGIKISIIGDVNAGKSTLFNTLLNKDRAIVTSVAGTTRDCVESTLYKNGNFWMLTDTAGLRQTNDEIEKKGVERSWQEAEKSDIVLLVFDATKYTDKNKQQIYNKIIEQYKDKVILVFNKIDKTEVKRDELLNLIKDDVKFIKVSAKEKLGIDVLEATIKQKIEKTFESLNSPFLLNQRQFNLIVQLEQKMDFIVKSMSGGIQYELIAYHLKEMLENLSELTGKNVTEKILDNIFDSFCIGK